MKVFTNIKIGVKFEGKKLKKSLESEVRSLREFKKLLKV